MRRRNLLAACPALVAVLAGSAFGQNSQPVPSSQVRKSSYLASISPRILSAEINASTILHRWLRAGIEDRLAGWPRKSPGNSDHAEAPNFTARLLPHGVLYISGALLERLEGEAEPPAARS